MIDTRWAESKRDTINRLLDHIQQECDEVVESGGSIKLYYNNGIDEGDTAFIVIGPRRRDPDAELLGASIKWEVV